MEPAAVSEISRHVALFDNAALEALGNRGLLRRAQKDIEKGGILRIEQESPGAIVLTVDSWRVRIPAGGPAQATCTCPSVSICQHVLAACLFLRKQAAAEPPVTAEQPHAGGGPAAVRQELLAYTAERLVQWAGKKALRDALATLQGNWRVEITEREIVTIHIPELNVTCRYGPSGGLDSLIVSDGPADTKKAAVLAILAYQRAHGVTHEITAEDAGALTDARGAPRNRGEILAASHTLLGELVHLGLSHASESMAQRAATLALSAVGVHLPRLSLALRGVADAIRPLCKREARASETALLAAMSRVHALCTALQTAGDNAPASLVGQHRSRYEEVGFLELHGMGAYAWTTRSGYRGLTVLFWESTGQRWYTWSDSRPQHLLGDFAPADRYRQDGPWEGARSPEELSKGHFKLLRARRNPACRLSGSAQSKVIPLGPANPSIESIGRQLFDSWKLLRTHTREQTPLGLKEVVSQRDWVVLRPAHWGKPRFDASTQTFRLELEDGTGDILAAVLPFNETNEPAIRFWEAAHFRDLNAWGLVGRAVRNGFAVDILPVAILSATADASSAVINPFFDGNPSGAQQATGHSPSEAEEDEWTLGDDDLYGVLQDLALEQCLTQFEDALALVAEAGTARANQHTLERFSPLAAQARKLGLPVLGMVADSIGRGVQHQPGLVLRAHYLCQLHRQAAMRL
jgi:hypothetical protein